MSNLIGFDCFAPVTPLVAKKAVDAGMEFVARYYGPSTSRKLLLPKEVDILAKAGLAIFPVFESTSGRALSGSIAGLSDAQSALTQATAVGQPVGTCIAFAIDIDVDCNKLVNQNVLSQYFTAVKSQLVNKYVIGAYGSGAVLSYLLAEGLISVAWLAGAVGWQGSKVFDAQKRWHLKQGPIIPNNPDNILGIVYDLNEAVSLEKIHAWVPVSIPTPTVPALINIVDLQTKLALPPKYYYKGAIDGIAGSATAMALVAYSRDNPPVK